MLKSSCQSVVRGRLISRDHLLEYKTEESEAEALSIWYMHVTYI